jgi:ABC-type multidrug transport system fused ATPase/permease subunit
MHSIWRLLGFYKRYWKWAFLSLVSILAVEAFAFATPKVIGYAVGNGIAKHHYLLARNLGLLLVAMHIVKSLCIYSRTTLVNYTAQRTIYDIRNKLFDHIQRLSFSYHDEAETGQLISRSTSDVEALQGFLGDAMMWIAVVLIDVPGIFIFCLLMNWKLSLASLAPMPILAVVVIRYSLRVGPVLASIQNQFGDMTTTVQQNLMGIRVVKAFAREKHEVAKFDREAGELVKRNLQAAGISALYLPAMDFIAAFGITFVIGYGGMQVIHGTLSLDHFLQFMMYVGWIVWPIRITGPVSNMTKSAVVSAERIFEILDTHAETHIKDGKVEMKNCTGKVEFQDVSFTYSDGSRALSGINLDVQPGQMVAVMGPTGSGKSSIINLLPRFYDVSEGAVLIDGRNIRDYRLESLRRSIGIVSQETFLFGDTIYENIAYGRPGIPLEKVMEAAKAANIHDFIISLPDGYSTRIGERGVNLSGGQKQRTAIARAILMNPPILILDDATASVDTETEAMIQSALATLTQSRTTFVIAQRVSTVKRADKIVVLDKGRILETGTHDELLARGGLYSEILHLQLSGQETEAPSATTGV